MKIFRQTYPDLMAAVRLLLLLPFLLTALLPQGYMPDVQAEGGFTVTLCTTEGLRTVTLDADGQEIPSTPGRNTPEDKSSPHCLFAGVGAFAVLDRLPFVQGAEPARNQSQPVPVPVWTSFAVPGQNGARAPPLNV